MQIGVMGLNYLSANLSEREALAQAMNLVSQDPRVATGSICLSTCNRLEVYFSSENLMQMKDLILSKLQGRVDQELINSLYAYFDLDCFIHLCRVTAGLDSAIFGESDIQRQVKKAYEGQKRLFELPSCLHYLFQKALKVGKALRRNTPVYTKVPELRSMIWQMSQKAFSKKPEIRFGLIGFSDINRRLLQFLHCKNTKVHLFTHYVNEARSLEENYPCIIKPWQNLKQALQMDVIVAASKQRQVILKQEHFTNVDHRLLVFDLSVPRNVDALLSRPKVSLYNIDQIDWIVQKKQKLFQSEIAEIHRELRSKVTSLREIYHRRRRYGLILNAERRKNGGQLPIFVSGF